MNKEELIGKLQMVYVGDINALNELIGYYDGLKQVTEELQQENARLKDKLKDIKKILDADCCVENIYQAMCQYLNIHDFELNLEDYLKEN